MRNKLDSQKENSPLSQVFNRRIRHAMQIALACSAMACSFKASLNLGGNSPDKKAKEAKATMPTVDPVKEAEQGVDPYPIMQRNFYHELAGGDCHELPKELQGVIDGPILPYFNHQLDENLEEKTESRTFEVAKVVLKNVKTAYQITKNRKLTLEALYTGSSSDKKNYDAVSDIYYSNSIKNNMLLKKWPSMVEEAKKIVEEITKLVALEANAAAELEASCIEPKKIESQKFIPLTPKNGDLADKHDGDFESYIAIQPTLRPMPYSCDVVENQDVRVNSSIKEVASVRTLEAYAQWHLEAAIQRTEMYQAIKLYAELHPKKAGDVLGHDGSKLNDKIMDGWSELLRKKADENGKKGLITQLLEESISQARFQTSAGEALNRCSNEEVQEVKIIDTTKKTKPVEPAKPSEPEAGEKEDETQKESPSKPQEKTPAKKVAEILKNLESQSDDVLREAAKILDPNNDFIDTDKAETLKQIIKIKLDKYLKEGNIKKIEDVWKILAQITYM